MSETQQPESAQHAASRTGWKWGLGIWVVLLLLAAIQIVQGDGSLPTTEEIRRGNGDKPDQFRDEPILGFAINAHHISEMDLYLEAVDEIRAMGTNALTVVTPMFQKTVTSSDIRYLPDRCPTDEQLLAILDRANAHGMKTMLLPIVLIENPGEDDWRGVIQPDDWAAWWGSYRQLLDRFITIANEANVDILGIGSELNTTERQIHRWRELIDHTRAHFDGALTYSANWDHYDHVHFWTDLDFIGISAYFELEEEGEGKSVDELARAWRNEIESLHAQAELYDRPLILSEIGYPTRALATARPWDYVAAEDELADHDAQARGWDAFFRAWSKTIADPDNLLAGFFGYCWDPYHHGQPRDTGYGLRGKPAHDILLTGFEHIRQARRSQAAHSNTSD